MQNKIMIYVLCDNDEKYTSAQNIYSSYSWAKPILLKYHDYSFENSFWKQLTEIQGEWETSDMVGTISYSSFKKINLSELNDILIKKLYLPNKYYHFMDSNYPIPNFNTDKHPHFNKIWFYALDELKLKTTTENCCNYWMCTPLLMKHFISWYTDTCLPTLLKHPLIMEDSKYTGVDWNNTVTKPNLIKLWGKPYYPHFPFVVERLNKCFFETFYPEHVERVNNFCWKFYINTYCDLKHFLTKHHAKQHYLRYGQFENRICYENGNNNIKNELTRYNNLCEKIVFLISHDKNIGGAQNCLFNVKNIYERHNIKTHLLYLEDIKFNIVEYILNISAVNNYFPIVFCNTLCCHNIVSILSKTSILTYWYIHEWFDSFTQQFFKNYISNKSLFNSSINLIFVCNSSFENYKKYIPEINKKHIIYNTLSPAILDKNILGNNKLIKKDGILYLAIIGTIETRKNQQNFINNVFYRLKKKFCNIKLLIVGEEREKLNIIHSYHEDIIVLGLVNNALPYINMSDIIVSYSINEVLPLNITESFYCSKPVVSSDVGGIKEMINDKDNGYLFKMNDSNACFNILCSLIENKSLRNTIGNNAKETFLSKFDEKNVIGKFLSLLDYTNE